MPFDIADIVYLILILAIWHEEIAALLGSLLSLLARALCLAWLFICCLASRKW